jgi:DNA-binding transcriptional LysR family regulator
MFGSSSTSSRAEELNFTRAAARCHVVQSALSYQIARLEREHGVTLFERTSRSVRLAAGGALLLPRARAALAELELAGAELAELAGVVTGRLRLGMIGSTGQAAPQVQRALAEFHHRHPRVEIAISDTGSRHMAEQVRAGELDLAFVGLFAEQLPADHAHRTLTDEPLAVAVLGADPGTTPADLGALAAEHAFVEMRAESGLRQQVDAVFARAGVSRRIAFELGTSDAVVRFVGLGFGPAVVPRSAAAARPHDVAVLPLADPAARHPIGLVHRQPEPAAPAARAFLTILTTLGPAPA